MIDKIKRFAKNNFTKVKISDATLRKQYGTTMVWISSIVTIISFFVTAKETCIGIGGCIAIFIAIVVIIYIVFWIAANRAKSASLFINKTRVEVVIGDIFDQLNCPDKHKDEISVIAVNNYYDTLVDNRIVAHNTLHGQYMDKIKDAGKLDLLNQQIETDHTLLRTGNPMKDIERKEGRKIKYDLGSLVEFDGYILTAFTNFDEKNEASLTADEYMHFWMKFWENIDSVYAARNINIPLMGAGITRFKNGKLTKQELVEIMLWSLKISGFHNTYGGNRIRFVIRQSDAPEIDFYHLKHNENFQGRRE